MNATKAFLLIALTLSLAVTLTLTLTLTIHATNSERMHDPKPLVEATTTSYKRASRFLAEKKEKNPREADHCHKDGDVCGSNTRCCNNKCVDLRNDNHNCGACKLKCKFTQTCCRGKCVNISFDKRNCGSCGNKCKQKEYCVYGMCNYA